MSRLFKNGDLTPLGLFLCGEAVVALALLAIGWWA